MTRFPFPSIRLFDFVESQFAYLNLKMADIERRMNDEKLKYDELDRRHAEEEYRLAAILHERARDQQELFEIQDELAKAEYQLAKNNLEFEDAHDQANRAEAEVEALETTIRIIQNGLASAREDMSDILTRHDGINLHSASRDITNVVPPSAKVQHTSSEGVAPHDSA